MKIYLVRHGETHGNTLKRYVGKTDEKLTENGIKNLQSQSKIVVDRVFTSPMTRCIQTVEILIESKSTELVTELRECNFGDFENLNYLELAENKDYQKWIDNDGQLPFPNGESIENFKGRCVNAFKYCVEKMKRYENDFKNGTGVSIALVSHNGNIMAIMQHFFGGDYYSYSVENGKGYIIEENSGEKTWKKF